VFEVGLAESVVTGVAHAAHGDALADGGFAAALLAGVGSAVTGITWDTALQQHVPHHVLSRVAFYDNLGSFATVPLGQLAGVPIAATLGSARVAIGGAILWAALTLGALTAPSVRNLHRPRQQPA